MSDVKRRSAVMREWLINRDLDPAAFFRAMQETGTIWVSEASELRYPRYSREDGSILGWKVRCIDTGKQWNDPGGVSHGSVYPLMWGDPEQETATELWIFEGESDLLAALCHRPMPRHVAIMAVPGANAFPSEWVSIIDEYGRIVLFPDNDDAGEKLVERVCSLVPRARRARLPRQANDVTEFLRDVGTIEDMVSLADSAVAVPMQKPLRKFNWRWTGKEATEFDSLLVPVIARDLELKPKGQELVALCPFHEEKTPSFHINPKKGLWRCQGCNKAGDVVSYVQAKHDLNYQRANLWLKEFK